MATEKTYFIKLTPSGRFCFGDSPQGELGNRKNYYLRSNPFPQQTGLLGFIRHQLLLQNGLITEGKNFADAKAKDDANILIGNSGFNGLSLQYGCISKISPVFITKDDKHYFWRDKETVKEEVEINQEKQLRPAFITYTKTGKDLHQLIPYKVKLGFETYFQNEDGQKLDFENVFVRLEQTGILMKDKQVNENAFYRQVSYKFNKGIAFGFYVTFDLDVFNTVSTNAQPVANTLCYFGKEKSLFKMEAKETAVPDFSKLIFHYPSQANKYVCLSDVVLTNQAITDDVFITGDDGDFNYLVTNTEMKNYSSLSKDAKEDGVKPHFNKLNTRVLKRGSVIYAPQAFINELQQNQPFYNIGFNHFSSI